MGVHTDKEYQKSIMASHEINDRDKTAKMLIIKFIWKINLVIVFETLYIIEYALYLFQKRL